MREYDYDENSDEFQDEMEEFFEEEYEEYQAELLKKKDVLKAMEMELVENSMDLKLLKDVTKMLQKSFWWRFYSFKTRLKMITQAYAVIDKLIMEVRDRRREQQQGE